MTEQAKERDDILARLRATGEDRDKFPRMDSERWLPVGLAKEAAAEIARLCEQVEMTEYEAESEIARLRAQRDELLASERNLIGVGSTLAKQRDQLLAALKTLITKMDTIHADKDYRSVWFVNQIHTGRYLGPTYVTELECARAAIAAVEGEHD